MNSIELRNKRTDASSDQATASTGFTANEYADASLPTSKLIRF